MWTIEINNGLGCLYELVKSLIFGGVKARSTLRVNDIMRGRLRYRAYGIIRSLRKCIGAFGFRNICSGTAEILCRPCQF